MCLSKSSARLDAVGSQMFCITGKDQPVRRLLIICCMFLALLSPTLSLAQGSGAAFRVLQDTATSRFAQGIDFRLIAEASAPIVEASLVRQLVGERVRARARPEFTPGNRVDLTFTWALEPGDLPPGTRISYYWELADQAGNRWQTDPGIIIYEDDRFDWEELVEMPIIVRYYGGRKDTAQEVLEAALAAAQRLQNDVGVELQEAVSIYVYNSKNDMRAALTARSETYDARTVTLGVSMGRNTLLILGSDVGVRGTVAHEMSHIVVGMAADNPYTDLPRWLDEGLAMYAEGELPADNRRALEQAIRNDALISVRSLSSYVGDPAQVDLFYGEAYSLVDFMLTTYGREKMDQLLDALGDGLSVTEALEQIYGLTIDDLDLQWRASLGLGPRVAATATPAPQQQRRETPICTSPAAILWLVVGGLFLLFGRR